MIHKHLFKDHNNFTNEPQNCRTGNPNTPKSHNKSSRKRNHSTEALQQQLLTLYWQNKTVDCVCSCKKRHYRDRSPNLFDYKRVKFEVKHDADPRHHFEWSWSANAYWPFSVCVCRMLLRRRQGCRKTWFDECVNHALKITIVVCLFMWIINVIVNILCYAKLNLI